jgi:hypothetical protein
MEASVNSSALSAVLIALAACSLFTMLSLNQMNYIVQGDLYNYGLQFSYRWAMPYWVFSGIVFGLSWTNIFLSIIVALYIFRRSRKHASASGNIQAKTTETAEQSTGEKKQRKLNEFLEPQNSETTKPKETSNEELVDEAEIKQPEESIGPSKAAQELQAAPSKQETEEAEPSKETEEVHTQPKDAEQPQSVL